MHASDQALEKIQAAHSSTIQKVEKDNAGCPVIWVGRENVIGFLKYLRDTNGLEFDFLADLTAYDDYGSGADTNGRFVVVYNLVSLRNLCRLRVKVRLRENETIPTAVSIWAGANWPEREVYDMFGVKFEGHPDLRRILLDVRWEGHPLRKDYPLRRYQLFTEPEPIPEHLLKLHPGEMIKAEDSDEVFDDARMYVNIGPSHPATHGTLRVMCRLNGETIEKSVSEMGYLHRAKEKIAENTTYHKFIPHTDRMNYCSALANNVAYTMAVEKVMGLQVPERTRYIRTICVEIARIIDHLICVGINAVDLGAFTFFLYGFHQREEAYTLIEMLCGARLTTSYSRVGGLGWEPPAEFFPALKKWLDNFDGVLQELDKLLTTNKIWMDRTVNVGVFSKEQALAYSFTGPCARASNINIDLRRDMPDPLLKYDAVEFDVPIGKNGDVYDRYLIRMEEMRQSVRILRQLADKCPKTGPIWVDDKRVVIPPKDRVYNSMESMIHHFKFFMEGFNVPPGEAYSAIEGPNGEIGFYIVSKGGPQPWRTRVRAPSFWMYQSLDPMIQGEKIADLVAALGSINIIAGELDR